MSDDKHSYRQGNHSLHFTTQHNNKLAYLPEGLLIYLLTKYILFTAFVQMFYYFLLLRPRSSKSRPDSGSPSHVLSPRDESGAPESGLPLDMATGPAICASLGAFIACGKWQQPGRCG